MNVEKWSSDYVVGDPQEKEMNELKLKEFNGRLTKEDCTRLEELRRIYKCKQGTKIRELVNHHATS